MALGCVVNILKTLIPLKLADGAFTARQCFVSLHEVFAANQDTDSIFQGGIVFKVTILIMKLLGHGNDSACMCSLLEVACNCSYADTRKD